MNPLISATLIGFMLGSNCGWFFTDLYYSAEISNLKTEQAESLAAAEQLYLQRYRQEIARADALSAQLSTTETQLQTRTQEVQRAISQVTTGKRCLDSAAVRLLNRAPRVDSAVPETTAPSVTESGAIATDTDVAGWIGGAQYQYDLCRARLNTLIDFETGRLDERANYE
ncbi:MAG: hypothetical protein Q7U98_09635 [Methylicorpusculum sp.]|uniref:hypothetical protein n=1 Tax=Methylicorpusculum sp. TaxID=2713644 RepID=UPI0027288192|nr:hypothetical protein [Methylicorpusculum sp.]MDO8939411.1 hypothetical protein [Methylicorpusculum sp.]